MASDPKKDVEKKVAKALKAKAVEVKPSKDALKKIQDKIEKKGKK
jgi:phosphoribosylaminoimidazole carboxylase (NCAIR synthetase)